jgi:hypothetical protein
MVDAEDPENAKKNISHRDTETQRKCLLGERCDRRPAEPAARETKRAAKKQRFYRTAFAFSRLVFVSKPASRARSHRHDFAVPVVFALNSFSVSPCLCG